jgi:peptide/nickel transport system substrate-binding protein
MSRGGPYFLAVAVLTGAGSSCREASQPPARLTVAFETPVVTFDPHAHSHNTTGTVLGHFYDALVSLDRDLKLRPRLARSWLNPSDTLWRFHLREGVVFHDGRRLVAADVVAALRRAMRGDRAAAHYLHSVREVRALGDAVVEVETLTPSLALLNSLALVPITPRDAPERIEVPVGTGPYRFVAGSTAANVEGRRFGRFWGQQPAFETVSFVSLAADDRRAEAIPRGEADIVCQYPPSRWDWGRGQASMRMLSANGLHVVMVVFSLAEGSPFADPRLRRAAALAIDRPGLVREGLGGLGTPLDQPVPSVVLGYSPTLPVMVPDEGAARRLVKEAGWPADRKVPLYSAPTYGSIVRQLERQLASVGIHIEPRVLPQGEFYEKLGSERLPAAVFGWSAGTGDASTTLGQLFHTPVGGLGRFNRSSYSNPEFDALVERADRAATPADRLRLFGEALGILREDLPAVPLATLSDLYAVRVGLEWEPPSHRYLRAEDVHPSGRSAPR